MTNFVEPNPSNNEQMKPQLQPLITPSLPLTVFIYVGFFTVWLSLGRLFDFSVAPHGFAEKYATRFLPFSSLAANTITSLLVALNSMIIAQMNNRYAFIRTRTFMPTFIYLFLSACWLPAYGNYVAALNATFALIATYLTLGMYKDKKHTEAPFLGFFLLSLSSFLVHEFVLLTVIFWCGFLILQAFSLRVFSASVFGFITPWILFFGIRYFYFGPFESIPEIQSFTVERNILDFYHLPSFMFSGVMVFVLIAALVQMSANNRQNSIMTRNILNFFKLFLIALVAIVAFRYLGLASYIPLIAIFYSLMVAYMFTLLSNTFNGVLFIVLIVANISYVVYTLITL